ncbi:N-6 DNA methylase [Selenomonas massiliensis]|uniref:N-6 DNA methylase n=1 Tax=Selenomonas massiliensis TaxID=2058293 RepID=UPI000D0EDFCC|nr:N-6 DNA methylase [Selenomonas massiliensis]
MEIKDILKPVELRDLKQFSAKEQEWLNKRIQNRKDGKPGVECVVRGLNSDGDFFELKPEEIVRQLYAHRLIEEYGYSKDQLEFEVQAVYAGREVVKDKRIDIAIYSGSDKKKLDIVIEVKRPEVKDENAVYEGESSTPRQQMESYCLLKKAQVGVIANGSNLLKFYAAPDFDNALVIDRFPRQGEDIKEWIENRRFTLKQLMLSDRLQTETLKDIILAVEQRFGANDSSDKAFEEIFKLIFTKLYDEKMSSDDADEIANQIKYTGKKLSEIDDSTFRVLEFRAKDSETPDDIYKKISDLFKKAKTKWPGVFQADSVLNMQKATVKSCVKELQNVKMFNSNLEVVDDAFEHLVNQNQKEGMGQYFTPRYVIDMCVQMLNPTQEEKMIDPAAGSCGFPMHTVFHVWQRLNPTAPNLFTTNKRTQAETDYVQSNVFGIDFSEKSVRVGRMLNIIAGDGHTNVIELNSLDYRNWEKDYLKDKKWDDKYHDGFKKLEGMEHKGDRGERKYEPYKFFDFDVLMANPPFAGDLDNQEQLSQYDLSLNAKGKKQNKVGRDILFIERNLNFLKPGGRMAIILPQGRFNNSSDKYIREYILTQCRLLAVIGLHGNVFKPHTGTKTSVLLVQKWTDENCGYPNICPKPAPDENGNIDYPIFFATMQEPSKDNSGDKIYVTENYVSWTSYAYTTLEVYIRKADNVEVPKTEYDSAAKKSAYKVKIETRVEKTEHTNADGDTTFIKDLFVDEHGDVDSHKKWIRKNVCFVLKNKKANPSMPAEITIDDYLALDPDNQKLYKETPILGDNNNPVISKDDYDAIPAEEKKFYLFAEEVKEWSERVKDAHGHIFVKHDLFNQDPQLPNRNPHNIYAQNGIAEAFAKFAYDERLSFAPSEEELQRILHPENELPF